MICNTRIGSRLHISSSRTRYIIIYLLINPDYYYYYRARQLMLQMNLSLRLIVQPYILNRADSITLCL
jgi:hypothetical protein